MYGQINSIAAITLYKVVFSLMVIMCFVFFSAFSAQAAQALAGPVTSQDLIDHAKTFDNKRVTYQGEVIGDIMIRGDLAWVNVNDGVNAIGVWVPVREIEKIRYKGGYKFIGDIVKVTGTFHRACPEHGGDLDIHATTMEIIKPGFKRDMPVDRRKVFLASGLLVLSAVLTLMVSRKKVLSSA